MDNEEVNIARDGLNILGIHVSLEVMVEEQEAILMCYTAMTCGAGSDPHVLYLP